MAKIPIDEREEELLLALYRAAADDEPFRRALGAAGRRYVEREHALPGAAAALAQRAARASPPRPATPAPTAPPLAPWDGVDPRLALAASLGADLADLGLGDAGPELLSGLAETLAELGLAPEPARGRAR